MNEFLSRRAFLRWSGAAAIGGGLWACSDGSAARSTVPAAGTSPGTTPIGPQAAPAPKAVRPAGGMDDRRLVVIELDGGNDGLSTLVPYGLAPTATCAPRPPSTPPTSSPSTGRSD